MIINYNKAQQRYRTGGDTDAPVAAAIATKKAMDDFGSFKIDPVVVAVDGEDQARAQRTYGRGGGQHPYLERSSRRRQQAKQTKP